MKSNLRQTVAPNMGVRGHMYVYLCTCTYVRVLIYVYLFTTFIVIEEFTFYDNLSTFKMFPFTHSLRRTHAHIHTNTHTHAHRHTNTRTHTYTQMIS